MRKVAVLITILAFAAGVVRAEDSPCSWVESRVDLSRWWVALCGKDRTDLVDRKTFEQKPEQLSFWWKMVFASLQKAGDSDAYDEMLQRVRVRCESLEFQTSNPITYRGREVVLNGDTSQWQDWKAAVPGSYAEGVLTRVCDDVNETK